MPFVLQPETAERWETIDLGDAGCFEVCFKKPRWGDLCSEFDGEQSGYVERRLRAVIVNWRGVNADAGTPVPFSWSAFQSLCEQSPSVFHRLTTLAGRLFFGLEDLARKNSEPPSNAFTAETSVDAVSTAE